MAPKRREPVPAAAAPPGSKRARAAAAAAAEPPPSPGTRLRAAAHTVLFVVFLIRECHGRRRIQPKPAAGWSLISMGLKSENENKMDGEFSRHKRLKITLQDCSPEPDHLPLEYLREITNNFSDEHLLGRGGFGNVYKGVAQNGDLIAVKKLMSTMPGIRDRQFENESERLLCLEYLPKGSLREHLSDESSGLDWNTRYKIIEGICYGLHYLHTEWKANTPIIHMDLKPPNILLDDNMVPKIADFGLSRLFGEEQTRTCTISRDGTLGYMAPEYLSRGIITKKLDIFSLGVIIIEIMTGRKDYPYETQTSFEEFIELVDKSWRNRLKKAPCNASREIDYQQIRRCIQIGISCVKLDWEKRPTACQIINMLHGSEGPECSNEREHGVLAEKALAEKELELRKRNSSTIVDASFDTDVQLDFGPEIQNEPPGANYNAGRLDPPSLRDWFTEPEVASQYAPHLSPSIQDGFTMQNTFNSCITRLLRNDMLARHGVGCAMEKMPSCSKWVKLSAVVKWMVILRQVRRLGGAR
ncbi:hypothetical protein ACP70R_045535 [Stipagrostis hirtigluma subsp. patula]